jgi:RNA polymerase sigma-70 factor (ECF subfamily)
VKSDKELIAEALGGSEKAYATLVSMYRQRIYRFIRRRVNDDAQAEEITQDVLLDAYRGLGAFKGDSQLYTWLCTIANRKCLRQPFNSLKTDVEMVDMVTPESLLAVKQKVEGVTAVCNTLPNKQRRALLLKEYDGLSYVEISAILGCSPKYAKKLVWKAKKTIRREMNEQQ